jgi:cytokinesis protein
LYYSNPLPILVTLQDLIKEYNELRSGLQQLTQELATHYDEETYVANPGDNFASTMHKFCRHAIDKFDDLEIRYTSMDVAYKDAVTFFGENPSEMKPDEFFAIFRTFMSSWEVNVTIIIFVTFHELLIVKPPPHLESQKGSCGG